VIISDEELEKRLRAKIQARQAAAAALQEDDIRLTPSVREAAKKAARDDRESLSSLIEKLLVEHLTAKGYLKK